MKYLAVIFFVFSFSSVFSKQDSIPNIKKNRVSLDISGGASYFYLRDEGMSYLIYKGYNFTGNTRLLIENKKAKQAVNISAHTGNLQNKRFPQNRSQVSNLRLDVEYYYLRKIHQLNFLPIDLYLGGSFYTFGNLRTHNRYGNNAYNYDVSSGLNISFLADYPFELFKRKFKLNYRALSPFYAYNVRPSFASSLPSGFLDQSGSNFKDAVSSGHHATVNKFFRWNNEFELQFYLKNNNAIKLTYIWDYYQMNDIHLVQVATHSLLIGTMFKF